jgi:hypothetical protein
MLAAVACHQSSGCCSDQRGRGVESVRDVEALLTTLPASSIKRALAAVVETSMPRNKLIRDEPHCKDQEPVFTTKNTKNTKSETFRIEDSQAAIFCLKSSICDLFSFVFFVRFVVIFFSLGSAHAKQNVHS